MMAIRVNGGSMWRERDKYFRMLWVACVVVVLCGTSSLCLTLPKPVELVDTVSISLTINVALLGFNGKGGYQYHATPEAMSSLLRETLGTYRPSSLEHHRELGVEYLLSYNVVNLPQPYLHTLSQRLGASFRTADQTRVQGGMGEGEEIEYSVDVTTNDWTQYFDELHKATFVKESTPFIYGEYTIIIINTDKKELQAQRDNASPPQLQPKWTYSYNYGSGPTQSWVSAGRYVVLDISAGPVSYGPSDAGEGAISKASFPQLEKFQTKLERAQEQSLGIESFVEIESHLATIVQSAVQYVFVPDIRLAPIDADKVLVPIIVMRNHNMFNPWIGGHKYSIDLDRIKAEIAQMTLPNQELIVLNDIHGLHEHKHIAMAVSKSRKTDSIHELNVLGRYVLQERSYLDSKALLQQMKDAQDSIVSSFLETQDHIPETQAFFIDTLPPMDFQEEGESAKNTLARPVGTRILPVYVFSLLGMEHNLLLDHFSLWAASKDAVIVLQTDAENVSVPYFSMKERIYVHPYDPTSSIIAGVGASLGGINSATHRYSAIHDRIVTSYMWAHGHQPWGVFGAGKGLSQIQKDMVLRNAVLSRLDLALQTINNATGLIRTFAQEYLLGPFGEAVKARDETGEEVETSESESEREREQGSVTGSMESLGLTKSMVDGLYREMARLATLFTSVATRVKRYELEEAYRHSASVPLAATSLADYVRTQLATSKLEIGCCYLQHTPAQHQHHTTEYVIIMLIIAAGCAIAFVQLRRTSSARNTRRRPSVPRRT
eukprot:TRINITY_DN4275_c0_g1_i1.p1 TRINITY_DN4275_c0_g1~~TRINITY_DN4275_c0_g1_i1.p1  ORF type:complete len:775 (-),score=92.21 TRINITY_DN4275_c0_g1_i1:51-2375(-)